jgi:hypothetical protein
MQAVVEVVAPLGVEAVAAVAGRLEQADVVQITFADEVVLARGLARDLADAFRQFLDEVLGALIVDLVQGVQPQGVEMVFAQPEEGVFDEEVANAKAVGRVIIDRITPGCAVSAGEIRAEVPQVVAFGPRWL